MTRRNANRLHALIAFIVAPLVVFAAVWALHRAGSLYRLETLAYDRMTVRVAGDDPAVSPVVIVGVSESDIRASGTYPISDAAMKALIDRLVAAKARVIGIDIYRDFPNPSSDQASYDALVQTIIDNPGIVIVSRPPGAKDDPEFVAAPKRLEENDANQQIAAASIATDRDGKVRRNEPFFNDPRRDTVVMNLGTLLALKYLSADGLSLAPEDDSESALLIGNARLTKITFPAGHYQGQIEQALTDGSVFQYMVDFRAPRSFNTYSVGDVMNARFDLSKLTNTLVIIGVTGGSVKDYVATPHGVDTFGFVMHGYIADQLIRWAKSANAPPAFVSETRAIGWTLLWAVLGALAGGIGKRRSVWRMAMFVLAEVSVLVISGQMLLRDGAIVPQVPALLACLGATGVAMAYISAVDRKDRQIVQQLMDMHISPQVADQLLDNREAFFERGKLTPQRTVATVLFSDLMDFTPIAERMSSEDLMNWLNDFFEQMTGCVEQCGGVVNKFNGDMVMALFGPPRVREKPEEIAVDARAAVRCAVLMRRALATMNLKWKQSGLPTPRMRIGIHTGQLVAGSLGGKKRIEYTVIGDTVNVASRLESSNKERMEDAIDGTRIVIGDETCRALDGSFTTRPLGDWGVKGKSEGITVHAVLDCTELTRAT